ncbi:MAG: IclR family transcriptional regulator [Chloroflexi bacterium]|nr:IclR family transcriptional regulator [Chloroflexota bacterium]
MKLDDPAQKSRYNIEALARGLEILSLFSANCPALSLTQIVETLQINKSTAYRVLSTLDAMQYLQQDPSTRLYRPGLKVLQLGFTAINSIEIRQIVHPYLERLSQEIGETVSLAVLNGFQTIYIDRIRNQMIVGVILGIGSSLPAHCTSLGKVLLADLPTVALNKLLESNELIRFTPRTVSTPDALRGELDFARQNGYALDDEELASGLRAASAPIRDISRSVIAAVNVTGTVERISLERLKAEIVPALLDVTHQISTALGYFPEQLPAP